MKLSRNELVALEFAARQERGEPGMAVLCETYPIVRPVIERAADVALSRASWIVRLLARGLLPALLAVLDSFVNQQCEGE